MPISVQLSAASQQEDGTIDLGEVLARDGLGDGEPVRIVGSNTGTATLRQVTVGVAGPGADFVQLAVDEGGPGVWAASAESIRVVDGSLFPGTEFSFWAKAVYNSDDLEGVKDFEFVLGAVSVGA